jgi:hypothetical protein
LRIDGTAIFDYSALHPQNAAYRVFVKRLTANQAHTIVSDSVFTAITYGFGQYESYGYNAGTAINNLEFIPAIQNSLAVSGSTPFTCPRSPFKISIQMAYKATSMVWKFSQVNGLTPQVDTTLTNPVPADSSIIGGQKYYLYSLPRDYYIADTGNYNVPITITSPEIDNCNNSLEILYTIRVNTGPKPAFTVNYSRCKEDTAQFFATGSAGYTINTYKWEFDDATTSTVMNPIKVFATEVSHPVKMNVIATNGCIGDTIIR